MPVNNYYGLMAAETGLGSLPLAPLVKQLQIWDTAEGMLAIVDQKVTQQGLTNVSGSLHGI